MTDKSKHTPGPWRLGEVGGGDGSYVITNGMVTVAETSGWRYSLDDDTHFADARLIAAAPDLLVCLKALIAPGASRFDRERARAAIAKATNATP